MITVHKGNTESTATFRLILTCDQCHMHVKIDVPYDNRRDQGNVDTALYLERARVELGAKCPHIQEEQDRQEDAQEEAWNTVPRSSSSYMGAR